MSDQELIKQEIERLKEHTAKCGYPGQGEFENGNREGRNWVCDKLLSFIDSLPEEPTSEDLEEASIAYSCANPSERSNGMYDQTDIEWAFEAGAEWQKQQMKEALQTEYEKGRFDIREEIMKALVNGEIVKDIHNQLSVKSEPLNDAFRDIKFGDKVKIIICKTEQQ